MDPHVAFLRALFADRPSVEIGVARLLEYCRSLEPAAEWRQVEAVDYPAELLRFSAWLREYLPAAQVCASIRAFYFGISEDGGSVHFSASAEFDKADIHCRWACESVHESATDWTESRFLDAAQLISDEFDEAVPALLYVLCLGYVGLLAQHCAAQVLGPSTGWEVPVAVGFQDGDAFTVLTG